MRPKDILCSAGESQPVRLTRHDLIEFEHHLKDAIAEFLPFTSYSLYFPKSLPREMAENGGTALHVPSEKKVLLPLARGGEVLGVFAAKGVNLRAPKTSCVYLAKLAAAQLDKLLLYKRSITDPLTGLHAAGYFQDALGRGVELVQRGLLPALCPDAADAPGDFCGAFGLILADIDYFRWINDAYGHALGDEVLNRTAEAVSRLRPEPVLAARLRDDLFALLWPDGSPSACATLAEAIRQEIAALSFACPVTGEKFSVTASLGSAVYPRDLAGAQFKAPPAEQARLVLQKAAKALDTAKTQGRNRYFPFGRLLAEGGTVLDALPLGRLAVSLGRDVDAREGQRFLVWAPAEDSPIQPRPDQSRPSGAGPGARGRQAGRAPEERGRAPVAYKAEISLIEVNQETSFAEILHLNDPAWTVAPGDRLLLLPERRGLETDAEPGAPPSRPDRIDPLTGLFSYRDFLTAFAHARRLPPRFCLAMLRLLEEPERGPAENPADRQTRAERRMRELAALAGETLAESCAGSRQEEGGCLGGRFSLNSLIYFLPNAEPAETLARFQALVAEAEARGLEAAAGLAAWPCLHFARADALENSRKAVDHALLLPSPRAALFDSVSLNISADRYFAQGDLYAAMEEYKAALLDNPANALARNSLGVCHARLNRLREAKKLFEQALADQPGDPLALYNLGYACQRLGETREAQAAFEACLAQNPEHVFCLVRLGRLVEERGDLDAARTFFERAAGAPGGETLALRDLARISLTQGEREEAREFLHRALLHNPQDAQALHLLARLYLDSGEDPEIAESLARQSAFLKPDQKSYWSELARALAAQGKDQEAREAEARALG